MDLEDVRGAATVRRQLVGGAGLGDVEVADLLRAAPEPARHLVDVHAAVGALAGADRAGELVLGDQELPLATGLVGQRERLELVPDVDRRIEEAGDDGQRGRAARVDDHALREGV